MFNDFKGLDATINKVSTNAVRIGGSLENADVQRSRATEAQKYFNMIVELNEENAKLNKLFPDLTTDEVRFVCFTCCWYARMRD